MKLLNDRKRAFVTLLLFFVCLISLEIHGQDTLHGNNPKKIRKNLFTSDTNALRVNLGVGFLGPAYQTGFTPSLHLAGDLKVYKGFKVGLVGNFYHKTITSNDKFRAGSIGARYTYNITRFNTKRNRSTRYYAGFATSLYLFNYSSVSNKTTTLFYVPVFIGCQKTIYKRLAGFFEISFNDVGFFKFGLSTNLNRNKKCD